jgi:hypothetical protein
LPLRPPDATGSQHRGPAVVLPVIPGKSSLSVLSSSRPARIRSVVLPGTGSFPRIPMSMSGKWDANLYHASRIQTRECPIPEIGLRPHFPMATVPDGGR